MRIFLFFAMNSWKSPSTPWINSSTPYQTDILIIIQEFWLNSTLQFRVSCASVIYIFIVPARSTQELSTTSGSQSSICKSLTWVENENCTPVKALVHFDFLPDVRGERRGERWFIKFNDIFYDSPVSAFLFANRFALLLWMKPLIFINFP